MPEPRPAASSGPREDFTSPTTAGEAVPTELKPELLAAVAGRVQFTAAELAIMLGREPTGDEVAILEKEQLKAELAVRKKVIDLAIAGSSPAQAAALDMIEHRRLRSRGRRR